MTAKPIVEPTVDDFAAAVDSLKLLADLTRLRIVWALLHGEHSVNDLAGHVGMHKSAVSQHLAKLRMTSLVTTRRDGNRIFYAIADHHIGGLVEEALAHAEHRSGDGPRHHDGGSSKRSA